MPSLNGAVDTAKNSTMKQSNGPKPKQASASKEQQDAQQKQQSEKVRAQQKEETSKAAKSAMEAQSQAKELTQAAAGAGDPDERQRLLNEALQKEVEAESFGKTAKYLNTGAFQGLIAGTGLGSGIGVGLGTLTGSLVGGTTGVLTGGLGAGIGAGVGAMHGPFFKMGNVMGEGIKKITGNLPGWKATEEQKQALEKMVNGVKEQDRPKDDELTQLAGGGGEVAAGKGYTGAREDPKGEKGTSSSGSQKQGGKPKSDATNLLVESAANQTANKRTQGHDSQAGEPVASAQSKPAGRSASQTKSGQANNPTPSKPPAQGRSMTHDQPQGRKPSTASGGATSKEPKGSTSSTQSQKPKKPPRKLEIRSK